VFPLTIHISLLYFTYRLYPVPLFIPEYRAGATEEILGQYISKIGKAKRDELVIATKVAGYFPNSPVAAARSYPDKPIINDDGTMPDCRLDATSVKEAVHASLRRLNTDHIDLLQLHWPDRYVPAFGLMNFKHDQKRDDDVFIMETATALKELIDEGKIRYIGLSNESTFGVCEWVKACEQFGISDKLATIQNSYSLLDRRFDSELAEACDAYNIGLLPWSVLAGGLLSGKYNKRTTAKNVIQSTSNSRYERFPDYMARWHPSSASKATLDATEEYTKIANEAGLTPSELAIAFVRSRKFVENGSIIVGATTMDQLKENLSPFVDGKKVELDKEVLMKIDAVHMACRDPCCSL